LLRLILSPAPDCFFFLLWADLSSRTAPSVAVPFCLEFLCRRRSGRIQASFRRASSPPRRRRLIIASFFSFVLRKSWRPTTPLMVIIVPSDLSRIFDSLSRSCPSFPTRMFSPRRSHSATPPFKSWELRDTPSHTLAFPPCSLSYAVLPVVTSCPGRRVVRRGSNDAG